METTRSILETQIKDLQARLQIAQEQVSQFFCAVHSY